MKLFHILALTSLISFAGYADETKWEVQGHMSNGAAITARDGGLNIQSSSSAGAATGSTFGFGLNAGVHYSVMPWLQVGLVPFINSTSRSNAAGVNLSTSFTWAGLLQVTGNFPMDGKIADAFFLALKIGYASTTATAAGAADTTNSGGGLAWGAEIGKRFAIFNNLSWKPSFGLLSSTFTATAAGAVAVNTMDWQINLISFAATW
jgi:hypothetical protein